MDVLALCIVTILLVVNSLCRFCWNDLWK